MNINFHSIYESTQIENVALFDTLNGIPVLHFNADSGNDTLVIFWFASICLIAGCFKLTFPGTLSAVVQIHVLLVGWFIGYLLRDANRLEWVESVTSDTVISNFFPILFYTVTTKIDYHTMANSVGLIMAVSIPLLFFHYSFLIFIIVTVLNQTFHWNTSMIWQFAVIIGTVQVEHCVHELSRVQGQMRVLQLVLVGERFMSFAVASVLNHVIVGYANPNNPSKELPLLLIIGLTITSVVAAFFVAYAFRCAITYFYRDLVSQTALVFSCIFLLYWSMEAIKSNGSLAVLVFGIVVGYWKIKYSSESERFFVNFWNVAYFVNASIIYAVVGFYLGVTPHVMMPEMSGFVFLIYVIMIVARAAGCLTAYPLIKRLGYQVTMKHFVISIIGVNRSSVCIALSFMSRRYTHGYTSVLLCTIITLLSIFFNSVLLPNYLTFFEMYKMSQSRVLNMNIAMTQINECREKCVRSLKMDRLIADSNWLIVEEVTTIRHPYTETLENANNVEVAGIKTVRTLSCFECHAENEIPPTEQEVNDMKLEAKQRILKAQLVCFWKQHEFGTLTRHGVTILNNLVEGATVKEDPKLTFKDLRIQREGSKMLKFLKITFGHLFTVTSVTHRFIPTNPIRAMCFRICTMRSYQTSMAVLSLVDLAAQLAVLHTYYFNPQLSNDTASFAFTVQDIIFFSIFFFDFTLCLLGIGVAQYFYAHANKVEFAAGILLRGNQLLMYLNTCSKYHTFYNIFKANRAIFAQKTLMLLRISRVYVFLVALIPKIMVLIDQKLDQDLIKSYDIGKAYLISLNRVAYFLNHIVSNETVQRDLLSDVEKDRKLVVRELGLIQKDRPTIAVSNKTLQAIRLVVIGMRDCISEMKEEGLLDPSENRGLMASLGRVKKRLLLFKLVEPTPSDMILNDITWLSDDPGTAEFLLKHAKMSTYASDEKIIYYGDDFAGLYVLVSGMVRCNYIPSAGTCNLANSYGVLPNCDYFTNLKFANSQIELIVSGNVLGELGTVTGRRYDMEVVAETRVQLYFIPWKILKVVIHDSGNSSFIQAKIWKCIGIRIATHLLHNVSRFRGWQDYKILLYLQRGIVPCLDGVDSIHMSDLVNEVILIEGKVMDFTSRTTFVGPTYIPRVSSQRLIFPGTPLWDVKVPSKPKLLIIPNAEAEMDDLMSKEGLFKYAYQGISSMNKPTVDCGQHSAQNYISRMLQAQRRRKANTQFMDYLPTVRGGLDTFPVAPTYIEGRTFQRSVKPGPHPRTCRSVFIDYTQDIAEQSEIEMIDENEDDDVDIKSGKRLSARNRSSSRFSKKKDKRKKSSAVSFSLSRESSTFATADGNKKPEIIVVDEEEDGEDSELNKSCQTNLHLVERFSASPSSR